jgi:signal transduction histidine kinase
MSPECGLERPCILLVDDHEENLLALEAVLNEPRYELVRADSGRAALRAALKHDFAVVLLDVAMPGMDGYETAAMLRERDRSRETPIIFLTANYRSESHMFRGYSVGAVDYMFKPFVPEVLRSKVGIFVELFEKREALKRQTAALQRAHDDLEQRVRDRTAQLAAANIVDRELRGEAERINRLKDEFLATLSHELRTPLNAIIGWAHLLEMPTRDPVMAERAVTVIKNNAEAQSQIIEDILDVSGIISGKLRLRLALTSIQEVIESAVDAIIPAADAKGISVHRELTDLEPAVVDRDRLQQVCWNVLSNAVKFTGKGGQVTVRLEEHDQDIVISVHDTGVGITRDFLPRIFDRFSQADGTPTRRHGGLGLGMAIVRHLVELHGGTVRADSPGPDKGSTFTLTFPRRVSLPDNVGDQAGRPSQRLPPPMVPLTSLAGQHVLLVDDEADSLEFMKLLLQQSGATVSTATSGKEALELLDHADVSVLVSDLAMPEMDGCSLIQRVRKHPKGAFLPAIAVSALVRSDQAQAAVSAGFDLHVGKPVEITQLTTAIDTLVSLRRAS